VVVRRVHDGLQQALFLRRPPRGRGGRPPPAAHFLPPVAGTSQTRAVPSVLPLVSVLPSRENATDRHNDDGPGRKPRSIHLLVSHSWMLPSPLCPPVPCPVASVEPSGENARCLIDDAPTSRTVLPDFTS